MKENTMENKDTMRNVSGFRRWSMALAETIDTFRLAPRIILLAYGGLVWYLVDWFIALETVTKTSCDNTVLKMLIDSGVTAEAASAIACTVVEVVGGPTTGQTAFVTAIVGLSTAIFGLYGKGGRDWTKPFTFWTKPNSSSSRSNENQKDEE